MMRVALILLLFLAAVRVSAQDEPSLTVEMDSGETVVGQPLVLRFKLLVPTWMPKPPEFPALEVPGLLVRLPERATTPISETISGETWSGVQRSYRLYPLQPGRFALPDDPVQVTYAQPGATDPISAELAVPATVFTAVIPEGARDLDPLIVAEKFELEQSVSEQADLAVSGSITRTLTARIEGTTPILIPPLTPDLETTSLRPYPKDPSVSDSEDRGELSGTRMEETTYVAIAPGTVTLPAVRFEWFNLQTGKVETAEVEAVSLTITGQAASDTAAAGLSWRTILLLIAGVLVLSLAIRVLWPRITAQIRLLQTRWHESELYAHRRVLAAIKHQDLDALYKTLARLAEFHPDLDRTSIDAPLAAIGAAKFGDRPAPVVPGTHWRLLEATYRRERRIAVTSQGAAARQGHLPPLNPRWTSGRP